MYSIIGITDRNGVPKDDFIAELQRHHGEKLLGEFNLYGYMKVSIDSPCFFSWADDSGCMLRTSFVDSVEEYDDIVKITTTNSVYTFKKVEEK